MSPAICPSHQCVAFTRRLKYNAGMQTPAVAIRATHLDFKGVPPSAVRLPALLDLITAAQYNALLVEWEDMFPWTIDRRFRSVTAYTPRQVRAFHAAAAERGLEIIPLVQILGHMETPLASNRYRHLRELPYRCDGLNPLAAGARELITKMVDDVLALTPGIRYFHLGGDEARTLGQSPATASFIRRYGKAKLYLQHFEPILDHLIARHIRPILWSDMMHDWSTTELRRIGSKADLCPWGYGGHPDDWKHHSATRNIQRFHKTGITLWGATAYKGCERHDSDLATTADREKNALAWVEVSRRFDMVGLIATGWSRNSAHRLQKQPIDACLDSLVNVGLILHDGQSPGATNCRRILIKCGEWKRWQACRAAMEKLTEMRTYAWESVRELRQQIALETAEPKRRAAGEAMAYLIDLKRHLEVGGHEARAMLWRAFRGLLPPYWIDRYLDERLTPLLEELMDLELRVRKLEPATYRATRRFRNWNLIQ